MSQDLNWLEQKARAWALDVVKLYHTPVPADFQQEKEKLIQRAKTIKSTIEKITGPLDALQPLNELSVLPFIAGGVAIAAAAAAITYWYTDYKKLQSKIAERKNLTETLIASGMPPAQVSMTVKKMTEEKGFFSDTASIAKIGLIGLLAYFSYQLYTKRGR